MTITRIMSPTPTQGSKPSHSPPDVRYAPSIGAARGLGWFGLGLGMAELLAPRTMGKLTGISNEKLLQAYGVREIATSVGILNSKQPAGWMWGRVAGDAMDLMTLLSSAVDGNGRRGRALLATAAVAGVTALDALSAAQLTAAATLEG